MEIEKASLCGEGRLVIFQSISSHTQPPFRRKEEFEEAEEEATLVHENHKKTASFLERCSSEKHSFTAALLLGKEIEESRKRNELTHLYKKY